MKSKFLAGACILATLSLFSCQAKKTVDAARAASCISSLTEDTKVVVKGGLTDELLKDIASAISEGGNKIDLDISKTTGLTEIGEFAFSGCGLTSVTVPSSVTVIRALAFDNCSGLTSVTIPDSVTKIGREAFYGCRGLTSVEIPDSVTEIGERAFYGCSGLENIRVSSGNKVYDSRSNCNAIIETSSNTLIAGCKNTVIPDSVTEIDWSAFIGCDNLKNINASERVTRMVRNAM